MPDSYHSQKSIPGVLKVNCKRQNNKTSRWLCQLLSSSFSAPDPLFCSVLGDSGAGTLHFSFASGFPARFWVRGCKRETERWGKPRRAFLLPALRAVGLASLQLQPFTPTAPGSSLELSPAHHSRPGAQHPHLHLPPGLLWPQGSLLWVRGSGDTSSSLFPRLKGTTCFPWRLSPCCCKLPFLSSGSEIV